MADHPHHHPAAIDPKKLLDDCQVRRHRASGPGGQHRNKVETAVTVCHQPTGITGIARERRSQSQNLHTAVHRLRVHLAVMIRCPIPDDFTPSPLFQSRCIRGRVPINPAHVDYPALLAEALDFVAAMGVDLHSATEALNCTVSQLVKLLRTEPRALAWLNERRQEMGLRPLR